MSSSFLAPFYADLTALDGRHRRRALIPRAGADFSSNDYLALAASSRLRCAAREALDRGVDPGSGGSRLLRGNDEEHEALEAEAAAAFGAQAALYFNSGYTANSAIFAVLPQRGDLVVHDELVHASAHDGMRLGRAEAVAFPHNDAGAADDRIRRWRRAGGTGRPWIAAESLYSMDGDRAPLDDLKAVADAYDGGFIIDEAHATGVFGQSGRGLADRLEGHENVIVLHTCGKALGASGALVTAPRAICDFLVNRARGFIFATAPSPLMAAIVRDALRCLRDEPWRRERLGALIAHAGREIEDRLGVGASGTQIQPIVIGDDARTMAIAAALQARGHDIRGIRPPTVPEGTSRLRMAITLHTDEAAISALVRDIAALLAGPA